jgi:hypothetical protein
MAGQWIQMSLELALVVTHAPLRCFFTDNKRDPDEFAVIGSQFLQITQCSDGLNLIQEHILNMIPTSHNDAFVSSQTFTDCCSICEFEQMWRIRDHGCGRSHHPYKRPIGDPRKGIADSDTFLLHADESLNDYVEPKSYEGVCKESRRFC